MAIDDDPAGSVEPPFAPRQLAASYADTGACKECVPEPVLVAKPRLGDLMREMHRLSSVAASRGYPAFLFGETASTPTNATPYVADLGQLQAGGLLCSGQHLADTLVKALVELAGMGIQPQAVLIGGSALKPERLPKDLDCVVFYKGTPSSSHMSISDWLVSMRKCALDIRLVPIDGDPILALKSALFFGALYGRHRGQTDPGKGLLLVDCRN
jgi:hypothetical protein